MKCFRLGTISRCSTQFSSNTTEELEPSFRHCSWGSRGDMSHSFFKVWTIFLSPSLLLWTSQSHQPCTESVSVHEQTHPYFTDLNLKITICACVCVCVPAPTWDVGKIRRGHRDCSHFVRVLVHVHMCAGWHGCSKLVFAQRSLERAIIGLSGKVQLKKWREAKEKGRK